MAISHSKKETLVAELADILSNFKMVAFAEYAGISVADLQQLRRAAREQNVTIKVVKNRLVKVAMSQNETLKDTDTSLMKGQVLYAISDEDEVMPAKVLATFAEKHPEIKLVGGFDSLGASLNTEDVVALAKLPSRNELIAQTVAQLLSPVNDVTNALSGNLHGLLDGLAEHAA
ncbi:MAG: 50S ribosomal protein L10 [Candidatus Saccharibacteria bacterium]|nr:50S ribosomal protein L10 [Candidatus Saccharibacteria bacterium]